MESSDHFKNGAKPKSQTSRKIKAQKMEHKKRTIDEIKAETMKLLDLKDEKELQYIEENFPSEVTSNSDDIYTLAQVEYGNAFPGRLNATYIRNLKNYRITVTFRRTNESTGSSSTDTILVQPLGREFVGYNCHTSFATNICSVYIRTEIVSATQQ